MASRSHFLELLVEILSKELIRRQIVERRGSSFKFDGFYCGWSVDVFAWLHGVVSSICGCLAIMSFVAGVSQTRNFYSACNFDIVRLNSEILTENEQNLKFHKQIKSTFLTRNGLWNLINLGSLRSKISFINLNYKQANFLLNLA